MKKLNRYDNRKKKRNLEYMKLDFTSNNKDSLREKLDNCHIDNAIKNTKKYKKRKFKKLIIVIILE